MNRLRATSGRSNSITIYEDPPKDAEQAVYRHESNDENRMVLDKLEALEDLSESLREISRAYTHSITLDRAVETQEDEATGDEHEDDDDEDDSSQLHHEPRKLSETFSTLSSEFNHGQREEEYLYPLPQRRIRHSYLRSNQFHSPTHRHESLTSSPRDHSPNPSLSHRLVSSPRSPISERQRSSAFRNPSSVRAMQLSSPSPPPFANSPRSARHRASVSSRNGTPLRNLHMDGATTPTPSPFAKHPNPNKEYPLVLLHCSVTPLPLAYSQTTLQTVLPQRTLEDIALLREKLGATVLERGILIPHPGEDYEVLEERVLESLELKRLRVGKCGHFFSHSDQTTTTNTTSCDCPDSHLLTPTSLAVDDEAPAAPPTCTTCNRHISLSPSTTSITPNWTIKVYASNGLLPPTAWTTAWREMEKVDLEVGVALEDNVRRALDREQDAEMERERVRVREVYGQGGESGKDDGDGDGRGGMVMVKRRTATYDGSPRAYAYPATSVAGSRKVSTATDASTAACTREPTTSNNTTSSSRDHHNHHHQHQHNRNTGTFSSPPSPSSQKSATRRQTQTQSQTQTPLSTLLTRYLTRQIHRFHLQPHILLPLLAIFLGLYFTLTSHPAHSNIHLPSNILPSSLPVPSLPSLPDLPLPTITNPYPSEAAKAKNQIISACTFPPSSAGSLGLTTLALPEGVAGSVLSVLGAVETGGFGWGVGVVGDAVNVAGEAVVSTVGAVGDAVNMAGEAVESTVGAVGDAVNMAGEAVESTVGAVEEAVECTVESTLGVVESTVEAAEGAVADTAAAAVQSTVDVHGSGSR